MDYCFHGIRTRGGKMITADTKIIDLAHPEEVGLQGRENRDAEGRPFPHIVGSGYLPQRSGCAVDTYTASYMRWESREDVITWIRSFDHPRALRPVFLDTETTGTRSFSEVIEVCVLDERGQMLYRSFVNPTTEIEPIATCVHGLTHRHVMHAPRYSEIHRELMRHLDNCVVVAYNAAFEMRLLKQSAQRYDMEFPRLHTACLMNAYAKYRPAFVQQADGRSRRKVYRLDEALTNERLGLSIGHRAEQDANCIHKLFHSLRTHTV